MATDIDLDALALMGDRAKAAIASWVNGGIDDSTELTRTAAHAVTALEEAIAHARSLESQLADKEAGRTSYEPEALADTSRGECLPPTPEPGSAPDSRIDLTVADDCRCPACWSRLIAELRDLRSQLAESQREVAQLRENQCAKTCKVLDEVFDEDGSALDGEFLT